MASIGIVVHSMYESTFDVAQVIADAVRDYGGTAGLRRVPELLPQAVIDAQGLQPVMDRQADVPEADVEELAEFDGLIHGSGTRIGNRTAQLGNFLDQTGPLWAEGRLVGKAAGFFTGASTMHGGHDPDDVYLRVPPGHGDRAPGVSAPAVGTTRTGGGPYGPTHFGPQDAPGGLSDDEVRIARHYGAFFHTIAARLTS